MIEICEEMTKNECQSLIDNISCEYKKLPNTLKWVQGYIDEIFTNIRDWLNTKTNDSVSDSTKVFKQFAIDFSNEVIKVTKGTKGTKECSINNIQNALGSMNLSFDEISNSEYTSFNSYLNSSKASVFLYRCFLKNRGSSEAIASNYPEISQTAIVIDISSKLPHHLWDNVFSRDRSPLTDMIGNIGPATNGKKVRTYGDFIENWPVFVNNLMNVPPAVNANGIKGAPDALTLST